MAIEKKKYIYRREGELYFKAFMSAFKCEFILESQ